MNAADDQHAKGKLRWRPGSNGMPALVIECRSGYDMLNGAIGAFTGMHRAMAIHSRFTGATRENLAAMTHSVWTRMYANDQR